MRRLACCALLLAGCTGIPDPTATQQSLNPQQAFYDPPQATPSYVPSASFHGGKDDRITGQFNFNWDAKLLFNGDVAPCTDDPAKTCSALLAFGAHPEAIGVTDYTQLNGVRMNDVAKSANAPVVVMEGARVWNDGATCGGADFVTGPGDRYGTFTIIPASSDAFLPTPVGQGAWSQACASSTTLVRYDFVGYFDQNFAPYDPNHDVARCQQTGSPYRQAGFVIVDVTSGDPCYSSFSVAPDVPDYLLAKGTKLVSLEASVSADGRFIVMNGDSEASGGHLTYAFNANPRNSNTWTPQAPLTHLYADLLGRTVTLNNVVMPATDFVPLARSPLLQADGTPFVDGAPFSGSYPWVDADASEVFYEAVRVTNGPHRGVTRAAFSVIGRLTGYIERHVDGWVNRDRGNLTDGGPGGTQRTNPRSPGMVAGLWNDWRTPGRPVPLDATRPLFPVFVQGQTSTYDEVDFDSVADGSDVLYLEMNELVLVNPSTGSKDYVLDHTPDTSGHYANGVLNAGVLLPEVIAYAGRTIDEAGGEPFFVSGKAVGMMQSGAITVPSSATLRDFSQGVSLGFFIRQDAKQLAGDVAVVSLPSALSATLNAQTLTLKLECSDKEVALPVQVFASKTDDAWKHVAMTYKPLTNTVSAYLDGHLVGTARCGALSKQAGTATDPLVLGPNLVGGGSDIVYWIDQVRLTRGERSPVQIARDALVHLTQKAEAGALPAGLPASEMQLGVDAVYDGYKAQLGEKLFGDVHLSANKNVACQTCHDPSTAFADPRGVSLDLNGNPLPRSAPSLFNRLFGGLEMWDGAHSSLASQATAPFLNPNEMGLTTSDLLQRVQQLYADDFNHYYGGQVTQLTIADAVSRYTSAIVSGDAPIDRYLGGDTGALTAAQAAGYDLFRGKARCIACHNGPNFSDEQFHRQGFTVLDSTVDLGRAAIACAAADNDCRMRRQNMYKTPSLRNVGLTKPYFHNHAVAELADVVALYNGGPNDDQLTPSGPVPSFHDPVMRPLALNAHEQTELVDFVTNALTSADNRE